MPSIVERVTNSPARSPSRRMIIDLKRKSRSASKAIFPIVPRFALFTTPL